MRKLVKVIASVMDEEVFSNRFKIAAGEELLKICTPNSKKQSDSKFSKNVVREKVIQAKNKTD